MKPFRERNPVVVGAISLVVLAVTLVAALRADDLPIIGGGDTYHAMFTEAGGLKVNDEVRIAGVRVGKVDEVELAGDEVRVSFKVDDAADFGSDTRAGQGQGAGRRRLAQRAVAAGAGGAYRGAGVAGSGPGVGG